MTTSDNILTIRNFSAGFKTKTEIMQAVNNISFSLGRGETIGIVGESGSGKSVTALSIIRLISSKTAVITAGEIIYRFPDMQGKEQEINLAALNEKEIRCIRGKEIAMIFQEPMTSLNPVLTCGYQVSEAIRVFDKNISKKEATKRTLALFNKVQLPEPEKIFKAFPHLLSGGQKQRVAIAMAISGNPAVLIADEPTTALDVTVQAAIINLLKKLQTENNMSLIFISHDLGVIAEIANRVLVMYKGRFVEQGTVEQIFKNPVHAYTKGLLACRPTVDKRLSRLPVISNFMFVDEQGAMHETNESIISIREKYKLSKEDQLLNQEKIYKQQPILKIAGLSTWFPLKSGLFNRENKFLKAVDNISFEVFPGETLGLAGESGCGKTTLGKTIARLIEPRSGHIFFQGKNLVTQNRHEMLLIRKRLQVIFQDPYSSLNPRMTIGEAILEPMQVHHLHADDISRKQKVLELLDKVNLKEEHFNRFPHEFSGGQRQRVVIARALAVQPEFIICDESVSALDVSVQAQVLNLLNDLKKSFNLSFIFISHDLGVVRFMSDRMIIMNRGKIEEMGTPDEIFRNPSSPYTRKLLDAIPKGL